jgi:hypothetical protein
VTSGSINHAVAPPVTPVPALTSIAADCSTDVSASLGAYLDSLPSGATFTSPSSACYLVNEGLKIIQPLSIVGGTFRNGSTTKTPTGYAGLKPVIKILDTSNVTLTNLLLEGANPTGAYHAQLDTGAGVKVISSANVTLTNITTENTFGDGLELVGDLPNHISTPDTGLVVDGFTTVNAGRQGVTLADVYGATMTDIHIVSPAASGFAFESDEAGMGSGNVAISNCTYVSGIYLVEYLTGPITFTNCSGLSHVQLGLPRGVHSQQPVTFVGGELICQDRNPRPCIDQWGGNLTFSHSAIVRRKPGKSYTEPIWSVNTGGHLAFVATTIMGPFGSNDVTSTVTITP